MEEGLAAGLRHIHLAKQEVENKTSVSVAWIEDGGKQVNFVLTSSYRNETVMLERQWVVGEVLTWLEREGAFPGPLDGG